MIITHCFRDSGTPKTGLSPQLVAWDLSDDYVVLNNVIMTELGNSGVYKYDFSDCKDNVDYAFWIDGGSDISDANERYIFKTKESLLNQIR